ncbi:Vacuolar protein sorting-associated protein 33A [Frankliniella fusca]|uniref:Vacuolar protein sorting-associated protein 33A n=1 Tax=Frankliniella fusca TaxID=407009 RepID=A0AAE1GZ48_9NEOP|nr:Vacuolar protein sorting-associated protein 33A [Frankliniella fusca]
MSSTHLSGGKVNISRIQEHARKHLFSLLDKIDGTKDIVTDGALGSVMGLVANKPMLKEHNIKSMFHLHPGTLPNSSSENTVFIIRPQLRFIDLVADNVHNEVKRSRKSKDFHIFFVPRVTFLCKKRLEDRGVLGNFEGNLKELPWHLYPFDSDLVSMEIPITFKEFHLENDPTTLHQAAQGLLMLQCLYGTIPRVTGIGPAAQKVSNFLKRLSLEQSSCQNPSSSSIAPSQIDQVILLDRSVDLLTPLATQLTYEGLIDEIFGIQNNTVKLPAEHFSSSNDSTPYTADTKDIILNSGEELFAEIRDKNFSAVGPALSKKARQTKLQFDERHGDKTVQEMKQFVARLPSMMANKQSLAYHTTIAELVKKVTDSHKFLEALQTEQELMNGIDTDKVHPFIEDCIDRKEPLIKVLRLVCMQALTNSGLRSKVLEYYKKEILQTYGFQHALTLSNLEQAGLLRLQQNQRQYTVLRKALRLTVEDNDEASPTDISYVHSVYAPLSIRLVQHLVRPNGSRALQDVIGLLPSPAFDDIQTSHSGSSLPVPPSDSPKVVLVFFIGGCTFAEISALRFLSQQEVSDANVEFVIATTKLINGNSFIESLAEPLDHY